MNKKELNDFLDKITVLNLDNTKLLRVTKLTGVSKNAFIFNLLDLGVNIINHSIVIYNVYSILPMSDTNIKYDDNMIKLECAKYSTVIKIQILDATKYQLLTCDNIYSVYSSICEFLNKYKIQSRVSISSDELVREEYIGGLGIKENIPRDIKLEIRNNIKTINIGDYFNIEEEIKNLNK